MKRLLMLLSLCCVVAVAGQALALSLSLNPNSQTIGPGGTATLTLDIAGLGDYEPPSLGAFSLDIQYDPSILTFSSVVFGNYLGDPSSDAIAYFDAGTPGSLYMDEVSLLLSSALDALQPAGFTLATLMFTGITDGSSLLDLTDVVLSDAEGVQLPDTAITITDGNVAVRGAIPGVIPEPCTMLLLGSGLAGLAGLRRRFKR